MLKSWIQSDLGNRNITQPFRLLVLLPKKYLKTSLFCSLFIDAMITSTTVIRESNKCLIAVFVFLCWPDMREWGIMLTELLRMCECVQYCDITPPRHIIQWWIMPALLIRWDSNLARLEIKTSFQSCWMMWKRWKHSWILFCPCLISGIKFPCYSPNKHFPNFANNHSLLNCVEAFNLV